MCDTEVCTLGLRDDVRILAELLMATDPAVARLTAPPVDNFDGKGGATALRAGFAFKQQYKHISRMVGPINRGALVQAAAVLFVRYRARGREAVPDDDLHDAWKRDTNFAMMEKDIFDMRHRHYIHDVNYMEVCVLAVSHKNELRPLTCVVIPSAADFASALRDMALYAAEALRLRPAYAAALSTFTGKAQPAAKPQGFPSVSSAGTATGTPTVIDVAVTHNIRGFLIDADLGDPELASAVRSVCARAAVYGDLVSACRSLCLIRKLWTTRAKTQADNMTLAVLVQATALDVLVRNNRATSGSSGKESRREHGLLPVGSEVPSELRPHVVLLRSLRGQAAHECGVGSCLSRVTSVTTDGAVWDASQGLISLGLHDGRPVTFEQFDTSATAVVEFYLTIAEEARNKALGELPSVQDLGVTTVHTGLIVRSILDAGDERTSAVALQRQAAEEADEKAAEGASAAGLFDDDED